MYRGCPLFTEYERFHCISPLCEYERSHCISPLLQNNVEQDNVEQTTEERDDIQVLGGSSERVNPETQVFYICQQYSLVFVLDMSTNMRAVVS